MSEVERPTISWVRHDAQAFMNRPEYLCLSPDARGVYRDMRDRFLIQGPLPAEPKKVAPLISTPCERVEAVWDEVIELFSPCDDEPGYMADLNAQTLVDEAIRLHTARVEGGKKGQEIKRENEKTRPMTGAERARAYRDRKRAERDASADARNEERDGASREPVTAVTNRHVTRAGATDGAATGCDAPEGDPKVVTVDVDVQVNGLTYKNSYMGGVGGRTPGTTCQSDRVMGAPQSVCVADQSEQVFPSQSAPVGDAWQSGHEVGFSEKVRGDDSECDGEFGAWDEFGEEYPDFDLSDEGELDEAEELELARLCAKDTHARTAMHAVHAPGLQESHLPGLAEKRGTPLSLEERSRLLEELIALYPKRLRRDQRSDVEWSWNVLVKDGLGSINHETIFAAVRRLIAYLARTSRPGRCRFGLETFLARDLWTREWHPDDAWAEDIEDYEEREATRFRLNFQRKNPELRECA